MPDKLEEMYAGPGISAGFGDAGDGILPELEALVKSYGLGPSYEPSGALIKALSAGSGSTWGSTSSGTPLRYEDLEATFVTTTFGWKIMEKTLFQRLLKTKRQARDVAHQFNRITGWGTGGAFSSEIADLSTQDVSLERAYADVKFARTKRRVSDVLLAVAGGERAEFLQVRGGNMFLAENAERYLWDGNAAIIATEPTGVFPTIGANATVGIDVIDLLGEAPSTDNLEDIMEAMVNEASYGSVTDAYTTVRGGTTLQKVLHEAKERVLVYPDDKGNYVNSIPVAMIGTPNVVPGYTAGRAVTGYASRHGLMAIWDGPFCGFHDSVLTAASSTDAPTTPSIVVARAAGATGSTVRDPEDMGLYRVRVSAENAAGESLACAASTVTLTTALDGITITITPGATRGSAYRVFVSPPNGAAGSERYVGRIADSGGGTTVYTVSFNPLTQRRPHCQPLYIMQIPPDEEEEMRALSLAVLAIGRKNLPPGDTYIQWSQFMYYAHTMYAPKRMKLIANMGGTNFVDGWPA